MNPTSFDEKPHQSVHAPAHPDAVPEHAVDAREPAPPGAAHESSRSRPAHPQDNEELIHSLNVFQAELEMQNDELRASQLDLQRSRDRLASFFHRAPVGYVVLDPSGMVVEANRTLGEMLGKAPADLLQRPFTDLVESGDRPQFHAQYRSFYRQPEDKTIELLLLRGPLQRLSCQPGGPPSAGGR